MNNILRLIFKIIAGVVICYIACFIFVILVFTHSTELSNHKPYFWIFKDSIKSNVDTFFVTGCIKEKDILWNYVYDKKYYVSIWEFKDLSNVMLENIHINEDIDLSQEEIRYGEVLDAKLNPEIPTRFCIEFKNELNVNLSQYTKVEKYFKAKNYKGFYAVINKMTFTNQKR